MEIDYGAIGQRIRKIRKDRRETQEQVSARAGITPVHYSHIETGNTKPSLPALIRVANALEVGVDRLLADNLEQARHVSLLEMDGLLEDCNDRELKILVDIVGNIKKNLRKL